MNHATVGTRGHERLHRTDRDACRHLHVNQLQRIDRDQGKKSSIGDSGTTKVGSAQRRQSGRTIDILVQYVARVREIQHLDLRIPEDRLTQISACEPRMLRRTKRLLDLHASKEATVTTRRGGRRDGTHQRSAPRAWLAQSVGSTHGCTAHETPSANDALGRFLPRCRRMRLHSSIVLRIASRIARRRARSGSPPRLAGSCNAVSRRRSRVVWTDQVDARLVGVDGGAPAARRAGSVAVDHGRRVQQDAERGCAARDPLPGGDHRVRLQITEAALAEGFCRLRTHAGQPAGELRRAARPSRCRSRAPTIIRSPYRAPNWNAYAERLNASWCR